METLVRVYIDNLDGQLNYYLENTEKNIANFIYEYATEENTIVVNNIFGRLILSYSKKEHGFSGKERDTKKVEKYFQALLAGETKPEEVEIIDIERSSEHEEYYLHDIYEDMLEECMLQ